jgi:TPP-dependent trihydroxycyclohexane-1,2-dione (THcHDO) dehydratase
MMLTHAQRRTQNVVTLPRLTAAGRVLAVFHQRRWDPDYRAIRSAVQAGEIGTMWRMETRRSNSGVYVVVGDGSAMYTVQSLWTMAREGLDVTIVIFANRSYRILQGELTNVGVQNPGPRAVDMLSLDRPAIDWVNLAKGLGVEASRATDCDSFARALAFGLESKGPYLVELVM